MGNPYKLPAPTVQNIPYKIPYQIIPNVPAELEASDLTQTELTKIINNNTDMFII